MNSKTHSNRGFSGRLVVLVLALLMLPPVFAQERPRAEGRATLAALKRAIELLHAKSEKKHVMTLKALYGKIEDSLRDNRGRDEHERSRGDEEDKRRRYEAGAAKIKEAIESGKISREDGEKRLVERRRRMWPDADRDRGDREQDEREHGDREHDERDRSRGDEEAKRRRYAAGAAEIKEAIESGKISREDGEKRLVEMRRRMWPDADRDRGDREHDERDRSRDDEERKRRRYEERDARIKKAIDAGEISREDGEKRLASLRRVLVPEKSKDRGDRSRGDEERKRRRYEEGAAKIEEAIESGKISREDGKKRLGGLKRRLWPDADKKKGDAKKDRDAKKK